MWLRVHVDTDHVTFVYLRLSKWGENDGVVMTAEWHKGEITGEKDQAVRGEENVIKGKIDGAECELMDVREWEFGRR